MISKPLPCCFRASVFASFFLLCSCTEPKPLAPQNAQPQPNLPNHLSPETPSEHPSESTNVALVFRAEDLNQFSEMHNSWQGFVNYFDDSTAAPTFDKKMEPLQVEATTQFGAVRRVSRVQLGVNLFRDNVRVYRCESDVLNFAAVTSPTLSVALHCSRDAQPSQPIRVAPVLVVQRETIGVSISANPAGAAARTLAMASQLNTTFVQEGEYAASPATFLLIFTPSTASSPSTIAVTFSVLDKSSGRSLINASIASLTAEKFSEFLLGKNKAGLLLSGMAEVNSHLPASTATQLTQLPTEIRLRSARGAEFVNNSHETRLSFTAEFETIDGSTPEKSEPFSGEFVLNEERISTPQKISIASYNVQGMGDDVGAGFPYEFSAKSSNWIKDKMYDIKAAHIAEAIAIADAPDVVAMEEIKYLDGKGRPLEIMWPHFAKLGYKYKAFGPQRPYGDKGYFPSDTQVVISKWPILSVEGLPFDAAEAPGAARDPIAVNIDIGGNILRLYAVHTKSKVSEKTPADTTIGNKLRKDMLALVRADIEKHTQQNSDLDVIVVGDMNADYFEDSIQNGLITTGNEERMLAPGNTEKALFNLWYELPPENRCDMSSMGKRNCLDHINISSSLYDTSGFQYVDNSFRIAGFSRPSDSKLVNATGTGARWQTRVKESIDPVTNKPVKFTTHLGIGYSDHFPIVADFRVLEKNNSNTRMTLSTPPAKEINHTPLFFRIPYCTDANGTFFPFEKVGVLAAEADLSQPENIGKCFELKDGNIPLKVVDTYDVRADFGFEFHSNNPLFGAISIAIQYDDRNPGGRVINRQAILDKFNNDVKTALAEGKSVSLVAIKGRIDVNYGKIAILAEEAPTLRIGQ
jgi:hypothetical protein